MVYFFSQAYRPEKTITRAVESVLSQTDSNLIYYVGVNNETSDMLSSHASSDNRLHLLRDEWSAKKFIKHFAKHWNDNDFFCCLDADDEYKPNFLEKILAFLYENNLDVAACGSDFIDTQSNELSGVRILDNSLILRDSTDFSEYFSEYHQFMRTGWGKIYRCSLLKQCDFENYSNPAASSYGSDTLFCMNTFYDASRVGVLAESLHKYYMFTTSVSYKFDNMRIASDRILDDAIRRFLLDKCGEITPENDCFLQAVYFNAITETLSVLSNAQIPASEQLAGLHDIFTSKHTQRLIAWQGLLTENQQLIKTIEDWILALNETRKPGNAKIAAETLAAMHRDLLRMITQEDLIFLLTNIPDIISPLLQKDWECVLKRLHSRHKKHDSDDIALTKLEIEAYHALSKPQDELFNLLISIKSKHTGVADPLDIDKQIGTLLAKFPILKDVSAGLAYDFSGTVRHMLKGDFPLALEDFIAFSQNVEIDNDDCEAYILLGVNLSAAAENTDAYIYFKKVWISYLLDNKRLGEADKELDEFEQILPEDKDFSALREKMIAIANG